jgi:uncharacterized membrane protein
VGSPLAVFGAIVAVAALVQLLLLRPWARMAAQFLATFLGESAQLESRVRAVGVWVLIALLAVGVTLIAIGAVFANDMTRAM